MCRLQRHALKFILLAAMCPLQPSCHSRLQRVASERRRLEIVIWQRCYDSFLAAISTPITLCQHSNFFYFMVHWVNATFFYEMVDTPPRQLQCFANLSSCTLTYKQRATRFACNFVSYAAPIRMVFQDHLQAIQANTECCKLYVQPVWQTCVMDFSMLLFTALNRTFFDNRLRIRNITTPRHVVQAAQAKASRRFVTTFYDFWISKQTQRLHHMLASSVVQYLPPIVEQKEDVSEDAYVQFLDDLLE